MVDQNSPFSYNIRQAFLDYIIEHDEKLSINDENIPTNVEIIPAN
jgi:hypothetical protein